MDNKKGLEEKLEEKLEEVGLAKSYWKEQQLNKLSYFVGTTLMAGSLIYGLVCYDNIDIPPFRDNIRLYIENAALIFMFGAIINMWGVTNKYLINTKYLAQYIQKKNCDLEKKFPK